MLIEAIKQIKVACILLILLTILTGFIYPAIVTVAAQLLFHWQANGSLIKKNNKIIGSLLIGQEFTQLNYFWGRPSSTVPFAYNAENSVGSNFGPTNLNFLSLVENRIERIHHGDPKNKLSIPVDLVTASGSGLDPDISPFAAMYQISRVAKARELSEKKIQYLVEHVTKNRYLGILGEPRINVLELNMALDNLQD